MTRKYNKPKSLEDLLPQVARKMGIESRLKELMIMNYWSEIAKGKVGKDSKPHSLKRTKDGLVLFIAAKSAMVAQELNLIKMVLLDKINILASQVGLKISDIVISSKYWEESENGVIPSTFDMADVNIKNKEEDLKLESIKLNEAEILLIEDSLKNLDSDNEIKNRIRKVMQNDIKLKKYKKQKGFSVCKKCGVILHLPDDDYCPSCFFQ